MDDHATSVEHPTTRGSWVDTARLFWRDWQSFLNAYVVSASPRYLVPAIWLSGMVAIIDRTELKYLMTSQYTITNWITAWIIILFGGILSGIAVFWIGGIVFQVLVSLSGGRKDFRVSRHLMIYAGLPFNLMVVGLTAAETAIYGNSYFTQSSNIAIDVVIFAIGAAAFGYSISLRYRGVRLLLDTKPARSVIFFILLPVILYLSPVGIGAYRAISAYSEAMDYGSTAFDLMNSGKYEQAEEMYLLALDKLTKDHADDKVTIYTNLALIREAVGDTDGAEGYLYSALRLLDQDKPQFHSVMGRLHVLEGNVAEAITSCETALRLDENDFDAHNCLGLIYLGEYDTLLTDYGKAAIHNEKANLLNPSEANLTNLALSHFLAEDYSQAYLDFSSLEQINPENAYTNFYLGVIEFMQDDSIRGEKHMMKALELEPQLLDQFFELNPED